MPATLEQVRQKFPRANYAPREGCKFCDGTGEPLKHPGTPCVCIFVSHDMADFAAEALAKTAKKILKDLDR